MDFVAPAHQYEADSSWRSQLDFKNNSLQKLAQKCIVKNKDFFVKLYERTEVNPFDQILNVLKKDLITMLKSDACNVINIGRETMKNKKKQQQLQRETMEILLLNKEVLAFAITPTKPYIADVRTWNKLAEKCPHLKQLYYRRHRGSPRLANNFVSLILGQLTQMEQLCVLEVDLAFDDDDLCILATSLPKLRVLQVQLLDGVTKEGLSALSALSELKEFIFWNKSTSKQWHLAEIFKCLPRLNVVGSRLEAKNEKTTGNFSYYLRMVLNIQEYTECSVPTKCQLQELELVNFVNMPRNILFPNLKLLKLSSKYSDFNITRDDDFAKLTDLILMGDFLDIDTYMQLLSFAGLKLRKLSLCFSPGFQPLRLEQVLNRCTNLEEFHVVPFSNELNSFNITVTGHVAPLPNLHVLKITAKLYSNNESVLSTLMCKMPNLQSLYLNLGSKLLMDDLVLNLQISTIRLQHLKSLTLTSQYICMSSKRECNECIDYYSSCFYLLCPVLQDLNIKLHVA